MKTTRTITTALAGLLLMAAGTVQAGPIDMFESCVNINGDVYDVAVGCVDPDTFDPLTETASTFGAAPASVADNIETNSLLGSEGLGSVVLTFSEVGDFFVSLYVDWEIDEGENTFFNEQAASGGDAAAAGLSFEGDEPGLAPLGFYLGDVFDNFLGSSLDNSLREEEDDVAMALGWDFSLTAGQTATVTFLLSNSAPGSGFWLRHSDMDAEYEFFFSSTLEIQGGQDEDPPVSVPEPGTLLLLGAGLLGIGLRRRRH